MRQILNVVSDRGSRYAVSGGEASGRAGVEAFLARLKRSKKFAKATHNSWAVLSSAEGPIKGDDGESGAGAALLRVLERAGLHDHVIVVTRWYGGVHLGGDRFRHITTAAQQYLALTDADQADADRGKTPAPP